jgi:hypothetical protein
MLRAKIKKYPMKYGFREQFYQKITTKKSALQIIEEHFYSDVND